MKSALSSPQTRPTKIYWVISIIGLLWMLVGVAAWTADLMTNDAAIAQMSAAQQQLYKSRPQWMFVVYAIAIFTGLVGTIGMLARKTWGVTALAISLIAIIVQFGYTFIGLHAISIVGADVALPLPIAVFVIGAFLLWYSIRATKLGWIRD
jgi:hypothetical protein